jgi:hypothetical protein
LVRREYLGVYPLGKRRSQFPAHAMRTKGIEESAGVIGG